MTTKYRYYITYSYVSYDSSRTGYGWAIVELPYEITGKDDVQYLHSALAAQNPGEKCIIVNWILMWKEDINA